MPGLEKYYREPLYRNSLILMLITGQSSLFNYVFWLLAGHMTSAAHVGLATAAISAAAMIVTLSRLGMDDSLVRFFPQSKDPGGFYNAMIAVMLLVTIVVMAGFFIGLRYFSPALMFLHEDLFSLAFAGYVFLTSVCDMQGSALVAIRRADLAFIQYGILVLRIPLLFILGSHGILGILVALDITYAIMLVAGVVLMYRKGISRDIHFDVGEVRKTLRFSIGNYTSTIVAAAPITLIPILIVNTIGAKEGAYFYMAYSIATFLFMVPDSISTSLLVEGSHRQPLRTTAFKALRFAFVLLIPVVLAILLFGDRVLLLFSSEASAAAFRMLQLLTLSSLFYAAIAIYLSVEQVRKNIVMLNYLRLAVSVLTLGLSFVLLFKLGLVGLGYAWLLSNLIVSAVVGWMMLSKKKWKRSPLVKRDVLFRDNPP